jgi:hypothetical protein
MKTAITVALRNLALVVTVTVCIGLSIGSGLASASAETSPSSCPNEALRTGPSSESPDCRAYEQVSPTGKGGFGAYPVVPQPAQVSSSGTALLYFNYQALPGAVGNTAASAAHVSTRTSEGWQTDEWTPAVSKAEVLSLYKVEYTFSSDLTQSIIQVPLIPLTPDATPYAMNLFHRHSGGAYTLVDSRPPLLSPETLCGPEELGECWRSRDTLAFAGASSDFSHVLFESNAQFTASAPETGIESLYENTAGTVHLVGILPDNQPAATSTAGSGSSIFYASSFSSADRSVERAVSQDGSHVIFQAPADGGEPAPEQVGLSEVYDRIDGTETIEISKPAPGATPAVSTPEPATFQSASVDGSRMFFTSSAELTSASNTGEANNSEDLYEYVFETEQLTDLTIDTNPLDATTGAMVQGVVDSSTDGTYVYFVAYGQLVEGKGVDGQPNLYMVHNGAKPVFIATLGNNGQCIYLADPCVWSPYQALREAYVTPDGLHMAFTSSQSLPTINFPGGYNNIDQETGQADTEVYEYTAPTKAEGTGQLVCASCDLTGAQPVGKATIGGISRGPGEQSGKAIYSSISTSFYRVRSLSNDGRRLFYEAPASVETRYDSVFEYEQHGEGTCANPRGCQTRISNGNSEADFFLGSNADGSDVFLATTSQLAHTDHDELRDIYDARVNGGIPTTPTKPVCEATCYEPGSPLSPSAPDSVSTGSSGNAPHIVSAKCKTGFTLSHGKCLKRKKKTKKKKKKKKKNHNGRHKGTANSTRETRRTSR